jgi:opacity protein-like surface antigen
MGVTFLTGGAFAQTSAISTGEAGTILSPFSAPRSPIFQMENLGTLRIYGSAYAYDFGNGFKTQIEGLSFAGASDRLGGLAASGNVNSTRITLKGMYEFSDGNWHVMPFLGLGFGAAGLSERVLGVNGDNWATAYQLSGGVALGFTEKLMGDLEYRWTDGSQAKFSLAGIPTNVDLGHNDVVFGINYKY